MHESCDSKASKVKAMEEKHNVVGKKKKKTLNIYITGVVVLETTKVLPKDMIKIFHNILT